MRRSRGLAVVFAPLALACFACSLIVDTSDLDAGCPGQKLCGGVCVDIFDAAYGCKSQGCDPCQLINAIPKCEDGECKVDACLFGFGCPTPSGCEAFVRFDKDNCGECGQTCNGSCLNGVCVVE